MRYRSVARLHLQGPWQWQTAGCGDRGRKEIRDSAEESSVRAHAGPRLGVPSYIIKRRHYTVCYLRISSATAGPGARIVEQRPRGARKNA
jgi:hypothetical protein